mmetsp:Transcript_34646/g.33843  ORF Transcript_34646/g.33843 Transcript_34646/m.33843 type:complete len:84 (+) Transcript_34646:62-313(+)
MFKLSQGEYIMPDKLENGYGKSPYIQQIFVYGDSLQDYLVCVIVPEFQEIEKWAKNAGLSYQNKEDLLKMEQFIIKLREELKD